MAGQPREEPRSDRKGALTFSDVFNNGLNYSPFARPSFRDRQRIGPASAFRIGEQWYRQVDNGRAEVLIPIGDPSVPPAELAQRQAAIARASFIANNPLAGVAYTLATLAGASPQARDRATVVGGVINTGLLAAAPLGARARSPVGYPRTQPQLPSLPRDARRYEPLNAKGQATGVGATITKSMLNAGKRVKQALSPSGWLGDGNKYKQDRGHLLAKQLGGAGSTLQEVVTLDRHTNRSPMIRFENAVKRRVCRGEVVEYFVRPLYSDGRSAPSWVVMTANGSRGGFTPTIIHNPQAVPR